MALWEGAMEQLQKRRTSNLAWQLPLFGVLLVVTVYIFGGLTLVIFPILGMLESTLVPHYFYKVSDDRKSATMTFAYRHEFKRIFPGIPCELLSKAKEGFGGLLLAIIGIITLPLWFPLLSSLMAFEYLNNIFWLKSYYTWKEQLLKNLKRSGGQTHVRGTHIAPSVQLSGTDPSGAAPPSIPQPLEVLDGLLTLNPNGGIILAGGVSFDSDSTFSGFSFSGFTLTRESAEFLKVSRDGSCHTFRFDGSSWSEA